MKTEIHSNTKKDVDCRKPDVSRTSVEIDQINTLQTQHIIIISILIIIIIIITIKSS